MKLWFIEIEIIIVSECVKVNRLNEDLTRKLLLSLHNGEDSRFLG